MTIFYHSHIAAKHLPVITEPFKELTIPNPESCPLKNQPENRCQTCAFQTHPGGFCRQLTDNQHNTLRTGSRWLELHRGETMSSGDLLVWPIIAISSGVLSLQHLLEDGRKSIAALFMQGDIIDMRGSASRPYGHLIALGKVRACRLSPETFEAAVVANPRAQKVAWNSLRNQAYRAMDHAADLAKKLALEKLASFVFECRRQSTPGGENKVKIPVRRIDLADYLGMQPETVSRGFKELQVRGIVAFEGISNLEILDLPTLRRIANGDKHTENLRQTDENHFKAANSG